MALLLITPWDTLANVAAYHYPWLPVRWIVGDAYNSVAHLQQFGQPLTVVVAERDSIVPARFGVALYESLSEPRRLLIIPRAEHNDWSDQLDANWWRDALAFLLVTNR